MKESDSAQPQDHGHASKLYLPNISGPTIEICVGKTKHKAFHVHKDVLTTSKFFQAAIKREWTGDNPKPIDLTGEDPSIFEIYVQWLYSRNVPSESAIPGHKSFNNELCCAYILGERFLDIKFQNAVIKAIIKRRIENGEKLSCLVINKIFNDTPADSPLRQLVIDFSLYSKNDLGPFVSKGSIAGKYHNGFIDSLTRG